MRRRTSFILGMKPTYVIKEPHEVVPGQELVESVGVPLCDTSYNVSSQSELKNTIYVMFGANDKENFFDQVNLLIEPGGHGHVLCSAHQFCGW